MGYNKLIEKYITSTYKSYKIADECPEWLKETKWRPQFVLVSTEEERVLAFDVLLSGIIPSYQYSVAKELLNQRSDFRIVVVTLEESLDDNPETREFCEKNGIGLKIIEPERGLKTIHRIDIDPEAVEVELPVEDGWFPSSILNQARGLNNLIFSDVIDQFIDKVISLGNNEEATKDLVFETLAKLVNNHSSFSDNLHQFMQLARIEEMLKSILPETSDHVLHSFRVFLAGCSIVNEFYEQFVNAQKPFCIGSDDEICVEYMWLLTAIFHDIGRSKESTKETVEKLQDELQDDGIEIPMVTNETFWTRQYNMDAKRILGSLASFIRNAEEGDHWDAGAISSSDSEEITRNWIGLYGSYKHGIVSAFDFLGRIIRNAYAADEQRNRPFILTHAAPAALSILLHDWKTWPKMKKMGLVPVNASMLPMAALLIYIDTWDNYKRIGNNPLIFIRDYIVDSSGACVNIEWGDSVLMAEGEKGYKGFEGALENLLFSLDIKHGMVGAA